jgi:1-phosphofructokinase family hexose kinase
MLLVVSPNLAMDRIVELEELRVGEVQRTRTIITQPGGKGSNVARVFRQLGGEVTLLGFTGRRNSTWVSDPLRSIGIHVEAIDGYEGETRVCTTILERLSNRHPTVINEESRPVEFQALEALYKRLDELLDTAGLVLTTGSVPQGVPLDFHANVIRRASGRGIFTAIDATGSALRQGIEARPALAKGNLDEMATVLGPLGSDVRSVSAVIHRRRNELASQTVVTLGENGAVLLCDGSICHAAPPGLSHINPIGAGDSFAAGYLKGRMDRIPPQAALKFATAVAASDAITPEPGLIDPAEIPSLLAKTTVRQIDVRDLL